MNTLYPPIPISAVIATYHNPPRYSDRQYVAECVASIRAQLWLDWMAGREIDIVVADASPDRGTPQGPQACGANALITMHHSVDVCEALRRGVQAARGSWVIPMNADDQLAPNFLTEALAAIRRYVALPGVVVVSQQPLSAAIERDNYIPYLAMFARWFWDAMGGFVDVLGEGGACRLADWDLWIRIWQRFGERAPVAYITDPSVIKIRNRPDSASKWSSDEFEALRARLWKARGIEP